MRRGSTWERVPRLELRLGQRRLPAWTTLGRVGALAGALVFVLGGVAAGIEAAVLAAAIAASVAVFVGWRTFGRRWRGGRYVLIEFALLALGATAGVAWSLGAPIGGVLDHWMIGLATCLAIGRLGCLLHGCCHGQAAHRGLRYPWLPPWYVGSRWAELRLFPLQAVEASLLAALAIAGAWLTGHTPGVPASLIAVGYAVARFELERRRGDARRYVGPLSHNQWWCVAIAAAVAALGDPRLGLAALAAIALLFAARIRRLAPPIALSSPAQLAELDRAAERALAGATAHAGSIVLVPTAGGVRVEPGRSSLSRRAARAIETVIAERARLTR